MSNNALTVIDEATREVATRIKSVLGFEGNDSDLALFATVSRRLALDPFARQIYAVFRNQKVGDRWEKRMVIQTGIDGYRVIAARTGQLDAIGEPEFGPMVNGHPEWAKVPVWTKGSDRPTVGVAYWDEYVQTGRDGSPMGLWARMGRTMLAKCAEAQALRKRFPEALSGVYTAEEMSQADSALPTVAVSEPAPPQVVEVVPLPALNPPPEKASPEQIKAITGTVETLGELITTQPHIATFLSNLGITQPSVASLEKKAGKRLAQLDEFEAERVLNQLTRLLERVIEFHNTQTQEVAA